MGYTARFTGEITITPPLTWAELRQPGQPVLQDLRIRLHEELTDIDIGRLTAVTGEAVIAAYAEGKGYDMVDELQSLADAYGKSHRFTGHIEATGDEGDRWRLLVKDGRAVQVYPKVVWPDAEG